jgi:hypothetical protein
MKQVNDGYKVYASKEYVDNKSEELKDRLDILEDIQATIIADYNIAVNLVGGVE